MRSELIAAVAAAALASIALAAPAAGAAPKRHAKVTYLVRGTLTRDATSTSAPLSVTGANQRASSALGRLTSLTAGLGPATHITKRGLGKGSFADLRTGDRVVVLWKAPRLTTLAGLSAANRVIDHGPAAAARVSGTTSR